MALDILDWRTSVIPVRLPAVMYLQRGLPIAENKSTTHRTHRTLLL
jgi:hypothetical protein